MGGTGGHAAGVAGGLLAEASREARLVYSTIKAVSDSSEGVHYNVIRNKSQLSVDVISKAVAELMGLGAAYTTVDEYHVVAID